MKNILPALSACYRFNDTDFIVRNLASAPGDALVAEALPAATPRLSGSLPVAIKYSPRLGSRIFMLSGRNLSIVDSRGAVPLGTLHADFLTVADIGSRLVFMTAEGPWIVDYDLATDDVSVIGARPLYPAISFRVTDTAIYSRRVQPVTFKGGYTHWSGPLDEADRNALTVAVSDACDRCCADAAVDCRFTAPVLAWYHLLDASGNVLYRSSPVLVEPDDAAVMPSCDMNVSQSGGTYLSAAATSLSVRAFSVKAVIPALPDADWHGAVRVRFFWSAPLDRIDSSAPVDTLFAGTSAKPVLRLTMPQRLRYDSLVTGLVDRLREGDCDTCCIGLHAHESRHGSSEYISIDPSRKFTPDMGYSYIHNILRRKPSADAMLRWAAPHSFSATTACVDGDMLVWGGISPVNSLPQSVSAWATAVAADEPWSAVVRVTVEPEDGGDPEILSYEEGGAGDAPVRLSRLISYPHPRARLIEIEVTRRSGTTRLSVPLSPSPAASLAFAMTPGGATLGNPLAAGESPLLPVILRKERRQGGLVLSALAFDPLTPLSSIVASKGSVVAITPASRSSSAWDFARRHLYLFGSGGIHALAVSSAMRSVSAHLIDSRQVESGLHVAWSPDGVYALSGGDLLRVRGSRAETVADSVTARAVGWCGATGRLYCSSAGGSVMVRSPDGSWHSCGLPGSSSYSLIADGQRLLLYSDTHMVELPGGATTAPEVFWMRRLRLARRSVTLAIRGVEVHLSSPAAKVTIGLYGDNGSRVPRLITSVDVDGEVAAPILLPVIFPCPFLYFTVKLEGTLAPGSLLTALHLIP